MQLSQAKTIIEASILSQMRTENTSDASRVVPYLVGGPGLGKTTIIQTIADEKEIPCRILSLAQYDAGEIAGWLINDGDSMKRLRPDWMPKDGKGILFLDELPQAPISNQNISAQIINERRVGQHELPKDWAIVCAGNKMSDRAGSNNMPTHVRDRLMFLEVNADLEDFIEYGYKKKFKAMVLAFIRFRPEFLHKFDRDADACPSPRSWERVNNILDWGLDSVCEIEAVAGQIGAGACADFYGYKKIFEACPNINDLIDNPKTAVISEDPAINYAICANLSFKMNKENGKNILAYLERLDEKEYVAFVLKDAMSRNKELRNATFLKNEFKDGGVLKTLALFK
jgi:hypothetical protein